jgi:uncharacterized protein YecE (DUF72 family)
LIYADNVPVKHLAGYGLTAYAKHPLLRAVEIDRTYYEPLPTEALRALAQQAPVDFRFVVKAHEDCTVLRFGSHARFGRKRGEVNGHYLDAAYATESVVEPFREGIGRKGGVLLFQFPPQDAGPPRAFAARLRDFLARLPKGVTYAVELRNAELLTPDYAAALTEGGAVHCHNAWSAMPPLIEQARAIPPGARRPFVVRWLLRAGDDFESARERFSPFARILEEDAATRGGIADLVCKARAHGVPSFVMVDNKAEGCAPESVFRLAEAVAKRLP